MTTSQFLAQYGIAEQSLSPSVKDGINEVLRTAGVAAIEQLGKIVQAEAQKRGINPGANTDVAAQAEAARIAKEEFDAQQATEARRKQTRILLIVATSLAVLGIVAAILMNRKRKGK